MWKSVLPILSLGLSGCGGFNLPPGSAPTAMGCEFVKEELSLEITLETSGEDRFEKDIRNAISNNALPVLYMSGGSQNGAFGAGFLDEWSKRNGNQLPDFAIVTGVSTGAILSLAAFSNTSRAAAEGYDIPEESRLLEAYVTPKNGQLSLFDYLKALNNGALGSLTPLDGELKRIMADNDVISKIAVRADLGRKLYIAATDVDTGNAVVFDMTEMAQRIVAAEPSEKDFLTNCFTKAVLASASVPLAAKPVFIDNRMYIDGGARFAIFSEKIENAMKADKDSYGMSTPPQRTVYMIINGDQIISNDCRKKSDDLQARCEAGTLLDPSEGERDDWSLINLAFRSVKILTNQVSRFSQQKIEREVCAKNDIPRIININPTDGPLHQYTNPGSLEKLTCDGWMKKDENKDKPPLEFHPNYMRCIMDYGRVRAAAEQWWLPPRPEDSICRTPYGQNLTRGRSISPP